MNILLSVTNLEIGGAQMFVLRLANALSEKHTVFIYDHFPEGRAKGITDNISPRVKILCYSNSSILRSFTWKLTSLLKKTRLMPSFREWAGKRHFKQVLKRYKIDIINSHMYSSDRDITEVIQPDNIPFVITTHGEYELGYKGNREILIQTADKILNRANGIVYTTEKNLQAISKFPGLKKSTKIKKIYVGFSSHSETAKKVERKKLGISDHAMVFGMVSRGISEKGWEEAIRSFLAVKQKANVETHLILIGNKVGNTNYVENLCKQYPDPHIHLLDFKENPLDYYYYLKLFDVGLLPSYFEGESVPNAVIEYLYNGIPVIATGIGEIPSMIKHLEEPAGKIIKYDKAGKADVEEMSIAMMSYTNDKNLLARHSLLAKEAAKKFDMNQCADSYIDFFNEIINDKG